MARIEGIITEEIGNTIATGQKVYDRDGKQVGTVDAVYRETGYFLAEQNPLSENDLYVPFRLITSIDPRELYVSVSRDELQRDYATPPPRSTVAVQAAGEEVATTTEPSGYTGAPVVLEQVGIDDLKSRIAVGDHVFTADLIDLGAIKRYDPVTGWMLVERGVLAARRDLMVPVAVVDYVDEETDEVYLVDSGADLQRMEHLEPADVVFVESTFDDSR